MKYWALFYCLLVLVCANSSEENGDASEDTCKALNCFGEEYECIEGKCYCSKGFVPNSVQTGCVKCPGLGEECYGPCCSKYGNHTLQCWQGVCQICYDIRGTWICRDSIDQFLLISITQVVMATALVLGIIATFILLYKLCAATVVSPSINGASGDSRLSIGSLQIYVNERLRDPPPRYSRARASDSSILPAGSYLNSGFTHDSSLPPPVYTERKEENQHTTVHI